MKVFAVHCPLEIRTIRIWLFSACLLCSALACDTAHAQGSGTASNAKQRPAWADAELPVHKGLAIWLDAGVQGEAAAAHARSIVADKQRASVWYDGSGNARHLVQPVQSAQPTFRLHEEGDASWATLEFDGEDDFLVATGLGRQTGDLTVFLVAAPRSNAGGFRGLLSGYRTGWNDYGTGITIDLGPYGSSMFQSLNVEGASFGGAVSLLQQPMPFELFHVLATTVRSGDKVSLHVDGKPQGTRPAQSKPLFLDGVTVGARVYSNTGEPPYVQGYFDGMLAEVLVFERALEDPERQKVEEYLQQKHASLLSLTRSPFSRAMDEFGRRFAPLELPEEGVPPVQVFAPGFEVRELPLDLPNINNVLYRQDGMLVALAYDGDIYLLRDSDGDGLEDKAEVFWENNGRLRSPIGMDLTPPGYAHGSGVFVASKGKCSLIVDTDGDDKADEEKVIAEGWKELSHGVDALGVAFDERDGSVYFGLGTTNFTNGYLVGSDGKAAYSLDDERGTVMRIAPDLSRREIFCTGIRFPVALRFHPDGSLFCTDQEGATWLPNGNPFDELLHLQSGRHYGFPPRHPKHLPDVFDEPSVFDYKPQHQSTCGLNFNVPVRDGGPTFGPDAWRGEAIVCGYSRGKLYRTRIVNTASGYVAGTALLGSVSRLVADACVAPDGGLMIAAHSGGPDWGSGPSGRGELFKIDYVDREIPQPVACWAAAATEVRVAFDRPLAAEHLKGLQEGIRVEFGPAVRAGDRFETLRPGYAVVQQQVTAPRYEMPVHSVGISGDRRTLVLSTDAHTDAVHYAVTLPRRARRADVEATTSLPQLDEIDLDYGLNGVAATWKDATGEPQWTGWLPHLDLTVSKSFTTGSAEHDRLWELVSQDGTLELQTRLQLDHLTHPAVQPGSKLDHEWPAEEIRVQLRSTSRLHVLRAGNAKIEADKPDGGYELAITPELGVTVPLSIALETREGTSLPDLTVAWRTADRDMLRALALERFRLPWVPDQLDAETYGKLAERKIPELEGGSWGRGRHVFFSEEAACSRCHTVHGAGGAIGPDLSNLIHRDYQSVLRDVTQPSYAINPDFIRYTVVLTSGKTHSGSVRTVGDRLEIGDEKGKVVSVPRSEVEEMQPTSISTMPEGIVKVLGEERMKDLLTYLLTPPPSMPEDATIPAPVPRARREVLRVLAGAAKLPETLKPLTVVLVAGAKDHGPGEHDYPAWQKAWSQLLSAAPATTVRTAWEWPSQEDLAVADVLVFYQRGSWNGERARDIDAFLSRGGGLVYLHYAVDGGDDPTGFAARIGLAWQGGRSKFRHGDLDVTFPGDGRHPIARHFEAVHFHDESYWQLIGNPDKIGLLAGGMEDGKLQPLFWTHEAQGGRVFVSIPGHFSWTFDDPLFRVLLLRGMAWTAREPVDRFNDLVWPGARVVNE